MDEWRRSFVVSPVKPRVNILRGWWLIGIGLAIYVLGFTRLLGSAIDTPSPIDQVQIPGESDLGFIPYLVSSESAQDTLNAPAIPEDVGGIEPAVIEPLIDSGINVAGIQEAEVDTVEGNLGGYAERLLNRVPSKLIIPKIQLEALIEPVSYKFVEVDGRTYEQWFAPDSPVVGWHQTSSQLGVLGNTILNGHHNIFGEVFRNLSDLEVGDRIMIQSGDNVFEYVVGTKLIVPEKNQAIDKRLENARWIQPSSDERVTLVTCWPYESNTHRVIVVAVPVDEG